jgi:hypothetical protein
MIADGEPDRVVGESFHWFAVEFWTENGLSRTDERSKSCTSIADFKYQVAGELSYLAQKGCIIDFGLKAVRTSDSRLVSRMSCP